MTPGQWDVSAAYNKFAAPPNAFVKLQDYQPLKAGGLRPFYASNALTIPGSLGASEIPCGIFARNGVIRTGTGGTGNPSADIVLVTEDRSAKKFKVWRLDGTPTVPAWSLRYTSNAANDDSHKAVIFSVFKDTNGVEWLLMSITQNAGDDGLWKMQYDYTVASNTGSDGLVSKAHNSSGPLIVSQAKIMVGNAEKIDYSDTGLTTFAGTTSGSLSVAPNRAEPVIQGMSGVEPSDILIAKEGAPWVTISGDITAVSTPVREMGDDHHVRYAKQFLPKTPGGVTFIEPGGRVFETDGRSFKSLSDQISGRTLTWSGNMTGSGSPAYANGYLVIPGHDADTSGVIFDFNTESWFTQTALNPVFNWFDPYSGFLYQVNHVNQTPTLSYLDVFGGTRVSTGVIQTVPYADKNGRNIDIREVHLFVTCPSAAPGTEFKVELIDDSDASIVTRYKVVDSARRDIVRLQFPSTKSDYLSVKITVTALDGSSEAATIERIRIGFGQNNQIH